MEDFSRPVLPGRGASDYERYLRTDELLALQKPPGEMAHRDELLFQTVHQTSELWLKLATTELEAATGLVTGGDLTEAVRLLHRANHCLVLVTEQLHVLEHMSPWEYQMIRRVLGHGSGFDSPGFVRIHDLTPALGAAFGGLLRDRNLSVSDIYRRGREPGGLYDLAEALIEWDESITLWRMHHFLVVQRIIGGHAIGTQGTPVEVLGKRIAHQYFPAMWKARDELTRLAKEEPAPPDPRDTGGR
jgi:tryptophan 2,3-dioxygenase